MTVLELCSAARAEATAFVAQPVLAARGWRYPGHGLTVNGKLETRTGEVRWSAYAYFRREVSTAERKAGVKWGGKRFIHAYGASPEHALDNLIKRLGEPWEKWG